MGNQSNCSVVFTLFKVTFLGKWDECGERPFLWTSYKDKYKHIFGGVHWYKTNEILTVGVVAAGNGGMIRISSGRVTTSPVTVQLYSRGVSSRVSTDRLCFFFRYYVEHGIGGHLSVHTLDNAGNMTLQWTVRGHVMTQWHFSFVQIHSVSGPFQVSSSAFNSHNTRL